MRRDSRCWKLSSLQISTPSLYLAIHRAAVIEKTASVQPAGALKRQSTLLLTCGLLSSVDTVRKRLRLDSSILQVACDKCTSLLCSFCGTSDAIAR